MNIKSLEQTPLEQIVFAMNTSFSDYVIPLQLNLEQLKFKIAAEDIDLKLSIGVFEGEELVAVMLHALREKNGLKIAYNAGTGVVPHHRRKGLVGKMYEALRPKLETLKINELTLEVIETNSGAVKAYEKEGYVINRRLVSFAGSFKKPEGATLPLTIVKRNSIDHEKFKLFWEISPSWQSEFKSIENIMENHSILEASLNGKIVGHLIFNPTRARIVQIAVAPEMRRQGVGTALVSEMCALINLKEISIYNIDEASISSLSFFKKLSLKPHVAQLEMVKKL